MVTRMSTELSDELRLELLASPSASGLTRSLLGSKLTRWDLLHLIPDAYLIAAELVGNAVAATARGGQIRFRCARDASGILIAVWDPSPRRPLLRFVEPTLESLDLSPERFDDNGGWGLAIIQALAAETGCESDPDGVGKTVWARLKR